MKLYEIPKWSTIKTEKGIITFHHLDGMYSYCTVDWSEGILHLSASQELEKQGEHYILK